MKSSRKARHLLGYRHGDKVHLQIDRPQREDDYAHIGHTAWAVQHRRRRVEHTRSLGKNGMEGLASPRLGNKNQEALCASTRKLKEIPDTEI